MLAKVRIVQRVGYEPTEIRYESSTFGYETSAYELVVGTKPLDTGYAIHCLFSCR